MSTATAVSQSKMSILRALPETAKEKAGSDTPVVEITPELEAKLTEIRELKVALNDAAKYLELRIGEVLPVAEQMRRALSVAKQKHLSSISLAGAAKIITQNKYSALPVSEEAALRAKFNGAFDSYFTHEFTLKVDVSKISEEALTLLRRDGAVTQTEVIKPTAVLHAARSTDPNVAALADSSGLKPVTYLDW